MIYTRFQKLCEERGVTPYTVSKATGVDTATLSKWKQGKYEPKVKKLCKIADFFGVTLDWLVRGDGSDGSDDPVPMPGQLEMRL